MILSVLLSKFFSSFFSTGRSAIQNTKSTPENLFRRLYSPPEMEFFGGTV